MCVLGTAGYIENTPILGKIKGHVVSRLLDIVNIGTTHIYTYIYIISAIFAYLHVYRIQI